MSVTPEPAHLSNHHRNTLRQILEHPVSHNIEWRAVLSLLEVELTRGAALVVVSHESDVITRADFVYELPSLR